MSVRTRLRALAIIGVILVAGLVAEPAFGAGSGYAPSAPPPQATGAGFTSIVTAQTVTSTGGTVTGAANGATCTVAVPAGAFPNGGEVVISQGSPGAINAGSGVTVVADFSVIVLDPDTGASLAGPFVPPITVTIGDADINASDTVVNVSAPGVTTPVTEAHVSTGEAVVPVSADPNLAVVRSSAPSVATSPASSLAVTGAGTGLALLLLVGLLLLAAGTFTVRFAHSR